MNAETPVTTPNPTSTPIKATTTLGAVVLAGGLARRMGGNDKGLITLNNAPMVTLVLNAVSAVADTVLINANRNTDQYAAFGVDVIKDVVADYQGPLAGLLSACEHLNTDWVLMCPCDTPFVESNLIAHLWQAALIEEQAAEQGKAIVVAHDGERLQPVFAIVRRTLVDSIRSFLERDERKIDRWYDEVGFTSVDCAKHRHMFDNINTPEQRATAEAQLQV